jgi:hypothetical protein
VSIFRTFVRDHERLDVSVFNSLAPALALLAEDAINSPNRREKDLKLREVLERLRAQADKIGNSEVRGRELFEVIAAEIRLGLIESAAQTFVLLDRARSSYNGRVASLFHESGRPEVALSIAFQDITNYAAAMQAVVALAEVYPERQAEIVNRVIQVVNSILSEDQPQATPVASNVKPGTD